jgi:hypothetical protein
MAATAQTAGSLADNPGENCVSVRILLEPRTMSPEPFAPPAVRPAIERNKLCCREPSMMEIT